ncbi:ABC transporter ATP-binding protein [Mesorhizobium sp. M7A.F.Ca.CA.001.07.2.1]|uniref:dipeptide ABC transporter ATP-binding protein n=4 Tax=Phyllobacteriaceae TaxID=69277 RepID=UPI000FCB2156|nr:MULTISPECIES: ABC transporter ATP-binding protein [Mesorhizobium]MCF6122648.1 ABC transporter ATP-binding protein [Mesorhizobium ciceri]MCQ8813112.1 ABC transporter ATP-binding protein [Mesorhizobium sp. SEMIA396]RUX80210.1 ABC transporter ATP-binding protein [Mesorhizobium sp. M7A.F.Ca.CA.004.08.2.1]RUX88882.1 ABC transporter ATP-binding protein [Mesorhizobium sp. M7A.F.Ca.CA.004.08.1.1]RUY08184.1 ABC transporter ATP-binding protein [Mesorhizobium sp. M7A.F.Ca.CA.004.04.1.1]
MTNSAKAENALELTDLSVAYRVAGRNRAVLRNLSLTIGQGEAYGLVGESGCGKSTVALTVVRYLPRNGSITGGAISLDGQNVMKLDAEALRRARAESVSMVYQDPGKALNPSIRVGRQLTEIFELGGVSGRAATDRAIAMLNRVRISDPTSVMQRYPHQLSGGMQQRLAIAMALANDPSMLILDEPTTGLDATVEAEVLDLIAQLRQELSASILFISHNLAVVSNMCDRVGVLYAGMLVEEGPTEVVFNDPRHPYTVALLRCLPRGGQRKDQGRLDTIPGFLPGIGADIKGCAFADRCALADDRCRSELPPLYDLGGRLSRCFHHDKAQALPRATPSDVAPAPKPAAAPVLRVAGLNKTYSSHGHALRAVKDVSVDLRPGETLGLVGESGSGKTTFARLLLGLVPPDEGGTIELEDKALAPRLENRSDDQIKAMQIVFQNPDSALNRSHSIRHLIGRALKRLAGLSGKALESRLNDLVRSVRLTDRHLAVKPRQLSGGLKQRVAIARAFAGDPRIVVCDEPTSALDVSVQAAILNLLADLQSKEDVSYIFISHDLAVVRYLSDKIAVLYLGRIMELGPSEDVFSGPHHPYTEALLSAVPKLDQTETARIRLDGEIPSATNPPSGCVFHTRCPRKIGPICEQQEPPLGEAQPGHSIRCHIPYAELARLQRAVVTEPA